MRKPVAPSVRQVLRSLRRSPWYAVTVVGVIMLTTALSATVFAVVDGVLFKALPYPDAGELYTASGRRANGRGGGALAFDDIRAWQRDLSDIPIAGYQWPQDAGSLGDGLVYEASAVDERFFDLLGQRPLVGGFIADHFRPGSTPVAIISHRLWRQRMGGSLDAIGRELPLAGAVDSVGRPVPKPIVVGVLPPDFVFPTGDVADILRPAAFSMSDSAGRNESVGAGLIRLPPGMSLGELEARLDESTRRSQLAHLPETSRYAGARVRPLNDLGISYRKGFWRLARVSGVLVMLACVAIATLASGRARQQERQTMIRRALGATSWDLFRQGLSEATVLTGAGAAFGLVLAPVVLDMTLGLMPLQSSFVKAPATDLRVAVLVGAIAFVTALAVALGSVRSSRTSPAAGSVTGSTRRVRTFGRVLIATQVALAFVLTLGGALGLTSLLRAWAVDPGYQPDGMVLIEVNFRTPDFAKVPLIIGRLNASLDDLPDVVAGNFGGRILRGGWSVATARAQPEAPELEFQQVMAGGALFEVLGLAPLHGRLPTREELARGDDVVVVSERAAAALWADGSAVGRVVHFYRSTATVIGVVREMQFSGLASGPTESGQIYSTRTGRLETTFLLRTSSSSEAALDAARRIVAEAGSEVELIRAVTMRTALADSIKNRRLAAWLHGGFASSALAIVATAILGLVAMSTSLRTREFGIRQALGARRDRLVAMLVREQLVTVGLGLAAGMVVAYWFLGIARGSIVGVAPTDYRIWLAAAVTILATAILGVLIPAVRSTQADPALTLRAD